MTKNTPSLEQELFMLAQNKNISAAQSERIWAQVSASRSAKTRPAFRLRFALGFALIALVIMVSAIGPQKVWAQIAEWMRLPGVGLVQDLENSWVLEQALTQDRAGISVTIEKAVFSGERAWVKAAISGYQNRLKNSANPFKTVANASLFSGENELAYSDSTNVYESDRIYAEFQFSHLAEKAAGQGTISFVLPQLPLNVQSAVPTDWRFDLPLRPAKSKDTLPEAPRLAEVEMDGSRLQVTQINNSPEGTYFTIQFHGPTLEHHIAGYFMFRSKLLDGQGTEHPYEFVKNTSPNTFVFRTDLLNEHDKMTFVTSDFEVEYRKGISAKPRDITEIDFKDGPQPGQSWPLDLSIKDGPVQVDLIKAEWKEDNTLHFSYASSEKVKLVTLSALTPNSTTKGEGGKPSDNGGTLLESSIQFNVPPKGKITFYLESIEYTYQQPLKLTWEVGDIPHQIVEAAKSERITSTQTVDQGEPTPASVQEFATPRPAGKMLTEKADIEAAFQKLKDLTFPGYQAIYGQAGWVHEQNIRVPFPLEKDSATNEPVGTLIRDEYMYLDENLLLQKLISIAKDETGNVVEEFVRDGADFKDLITGQRANIPEMIIKWSGHPVRTNDLPIDLAHELYSYSLDEVDYDGEKALMLSTYANKPQNTHLGGVDCNLSSLISREWYSIESGLLLQRQEEATCVGETEPRISTMTYQVQERISAPAPEIESLLEQARQP